MKKTFWRLIIVLFILGIFSTSVYADSLVVTISSLKSNPEIYIGKNVKVTGFFSIWKNAPGAPPISRSDWVICDKEKNGLYCNGAMPCDEETGEIESYWKQIDVEGIFDIKDNQPYIIVNNTKVSVPKIEKMVTVSQIILNHHEMVGNYIGIMGVLAKGYGIKGDRMYLIADPTGAIRIGRTTKIYPKGTIMHIKGIVTTDQYGMPMIDQVEIISAKVD